MSISRKTTGWQQERATPLLPFDQADQPLTPTSRRRARGAARRTSEASLKAFDEIKAKRSRLYKPILEVIAERGPAAADCLTSREILRALIEQDDLPEVAEVLSVRPRLTELSQAGCLENPLDPADETKTFLKAVAGECRASVWRITERGRAFFDYLQQQTQHKEV